jgi:hypothetical protein
MVPESLWKNEPAGADARNARSLRLTLSAALRAGIIDLRVSNRELSDCKKPSLIGIDCLMCRHAKT